MKKIFFRNRTVFCLTLLLGALLLHPSYLEATPDFAKQTGQSCTACHVESHGGTLNDAGHDFAATVSDQGQSSSESGYRVLHPFQKPVRLLVGLIHIVASFLWFGTILYVHILLKPAYADKGLPKGEVRLGIVSMFLVGISGVLLTISKIKSIDILFTTQWGIVLSVKIALYLIMISSAAFVVTFIGPKLRRKPLKFEKPSDGVFNSATLAYFDGTQDRDCYFAYDGKVYDATNSSFWNEGKHMKHNAGTDLTDELKWAPHGIENLGQLEIVGTYDSTKAPEKTIHQKIFYFIAYMNLTIVFLILFTISYWRWGL